VPFIKVQDLDAEAYTVHEERLGSEPERLERLRRVLGEVDARLITLTVATAAQKIGQREADTDGYVEPVQHRLALSDRPIARLPKLLYPMQSYRFGIACRAAAHQSPSNEAPIYCHGPAYETAFSGILAITNR